jgi:N-acetylglucosamine kinase-like BadF-type ATPase
VSLALGIDTGQSGSRLAIVGPDGGELSWVAPGLRPGMSPVEAMAGPLLDGTVTRLQGLDLGPLCVVGAGMTGLHAGATGADRVLSAWAKRLGVRRLVIADDAVTSYLGALGARHGAVVAAGTGVTVLAADGEASARVNGWGPTLGDEGGGYWIGQHGLRSAYRHLDGRGGSRRLAGEAQDTFGDLTRLPARIAGSDDQTAMIAAFSLRVAEVARAGDPEANRIWSEAGRELARAALAALKRLRKGRAADDPILPVSWNGSLFRAGDLLLRPFYNALAAAGTGAEAVPPAADSLAGAIGLTTDQNLARFGALVDIAEIG